MSDTKVVNIAFDPDIETWSVLALQKLIEELHNDTGINMYIITTEDDVDFINRVVKEVGIDENNVYHSLIDVNSVIDNLKETNCNIYLSDDSFLGREIEKENNILLKTNNVSGSKFIEFNNILDHYLAQPKVLTNITFWVDQIRKYLNGKEDNK